MALNIRQARRDDVAALGTVARAAKASWGYPAPWLEEWREALTFTAEELDRHAVVVAEAEGEPVGVAALNDEGDQAELHHLWVHPTAQGTGVGRSLMEWALSEARSRGCSSVRVESDPHAVDFYRRFGAVRIGEVPAPVAGTERSLPVLRIPLNPDP